MDFYDSNLKQIQTKALLELRGINLSTEQLKTIGIYPIEYNYPTYNPDTHTIEPKGSIHLKKGYKDVYVQDFNVVELDNETQKSRLDNKFELKRQEILQKADDSVQSYMNLFSNVEKETWAKQQEEVEKYLADNSAATPTLDGLAKARGISREEMLTKAISKVNSFVPLSIYIVGTQQSLEDKITKIYSDENKTYAQRMKELDEIDIEIVLPTTE